MNPAFLSFLRPPFIASSIIFINLYFDGLPLIYGLNYGTVWKGLFIVALLFIIINNRNDNLSRVEKSVFFGYIFSLWPLITGVINGNMEQEFYIAFQRLFVVTIYHCAILYFTDKSVYRFIISFSIIIVSTAPLFYFGLIASQHAGYSLEKIGGGSGFIGIFQTPHGASQILSLLFVIVFGMFLAKNPIIGSRQQGLFYYVITAGLLGLTALTFVRSGLIAISVGVIVLIYGLRKSSIAKSCLYIFSMIIMCAYLFVYYEDFFQVYLNRLLGLTGYIQRDSISIDTVSSGRTLIWEGAMNVHINSDILQKIFGIGQENLIQEMYQVIGVAVFAHNGFLNELITHGYIGLALLILWLFYLFKDTKKNKSKNPEYMVVFLALLFAWIAFHFFQGGESPLGTSLVCLVSVYVQKNRSFNKELKV